MVSEATISVKQGFLSEEGHAQVYAAVEKQTRMLSGLRLSLELAEPFPDPQPSILNPQPCLNGVSISSESFFLTEPKNVQPAFYRLHKQ